MIGGRPGATGCGADKETSEDAAQRQLAGRRATFVRRIPTPVSKNSIVRHDPIAGNQAALVRGRGWMKANGNGPDN